MNPDNVNAAARDAITTYLAIDKPGYALLLNAPWGAGKTHLIRTTVPKNDARYVSLSGVDNEDEFRRALLRESIAASTLERGSSLATIAGQIFRRPQLGDLVSRFAEEHLLAQLPDTLIFDDLERCTLKPEVLFGLINEHVEHRRRRVLLVANEERHPSTKLFRSRKEKIVGRTVTVAANFGSAFPLFLDSLPAGVGREYLAANESLVARVFSDSKNQNLRLLRNTMLETSSLLNRIEEEYFLAKDTMARFVCTYMALTMALMRGDITKKDIKKRSDFRIAWPNEENSDDDRLEGLRKLYKKHREGYEIYSHTGAALSDEIAHELFVTGYMPTDALNAAIDKTSQFVVDDDDTLWKSMVHWGEQSDEKLAQLLDDAYTYVFKSTSISPGPFIHIVDALHQVHQYGGLENDLSFSVDDVIEKIETLQTTGGIPAADFGELFGWSKEDGRFAYGGYAFSLTTEMQRLADAMTSAQMKSFEQTLPEHASALLELFCNDPSSLIDMIEFRQDLRSFHRYPIFQHVSVELFSAAATTHLNAGHSRTMLDVFRAIQKRIPPNATDGWESESEWINRVYQEMRNVSKGFGQLNLARTERFLHFAQRR